MANDFYDATMWCERCSEYVRFLQSTEKAFCTECGERVQMLRDDDIRRIRRLLGGAKPRRAGSEGASTPA